MIELDLQSRTPVYQQIKERIIELIMMDLLAPDEKLPSVRSLATELGINPNTIQKAYQELEGEGVIYTVGGKGCFVSKRENAEELMHLKLVENLKETMRTAKLAGIPLEELEGMAREIYGGEDEC